MKLVTDIKYAERDNAYFDLYLAEGDSFDLLIWFHGGGLEEGSRKSIVFQDALLEKGIAIASVEYRMYPEVKFPVFIEDSARAVKYILDNIGTYGNAKRVIISGQSAGAYITLMLCLDKHYLADAGVDRKDIYAFVSDSAQITTHYRVLGERGMDNRLERIDEAAPIYHLSADSEFDNLLIIYYTEDMPCRPEQNILFYKSVQRFCPNSRVELKELKGGHCRGSSVKNDDGSYDYNIALLEFIGK